MTLAPLTLPAQSSPARHKPATRLINCYAEERGPEGIVPYPLYVTDGLTTFATLSDGGAYRGGIVSKGFAYVVSGKQAFKVDSGGGATALGGIPSEGRVYMAVNQKAPTPQIMFVGQGVYGLIENDTVVAITDSDLQPPNSVVFLNQYFVATIPSGRFQWSSLSEGSEWDPLDFATAEYGPDGLNRALVRRGELLLFGDQTIEPWYTPASGDAVFLRSGSVIERGCLNGATVAMLEETPIFVADDKTVRAIEGYTARVISTHAVERSIRDTAVPANMSAFAYSKDGHFFYCLSGDDFTWVYDARTDKWHERQSGSSTRWRGNGYLYFAGKHLTGCAFGGILLEMSNTTFGEPEAPTIMRVQVPVHAYPRRVQLDELRINTVPGQGLNSSDAHNANPLCMVKVSKNGGRTFGNERQISMGRIGEYSRQVRAGRLGTSNEDGFVLDISMSSSVARGIEGLAAEMKVLGV